MFSMNLLFYIAALITFLTANLTVANYAPTTNNCPPDTKLVRRPHGLSKDEADWVRGRKNVAAASFATYLSRLNFSDFDINAYQGKIQDCPSTHMPTIAWANSGGGWRTAFTGVGGNRALDDSLPAAIEAGTGGLLQSMTYYAGLSGGSWPVSSYALHGYPSIDELVAGWHVNINRINATNDSSDAATWETMFKQIYPKFEAGWNVSISDVFGRFFAYEFLPGNDGGLETTWSSIADLPEFQNFSGPMPILQASSIEGGDTEAYGVYEPTANNTIYEWTPFEFGSWDDAFTPTRYVGSMLSENGTASQCVEGLDRASFVMSSAASAYNWWWLSAVTNGTLGQFSKRTTRFDTHDIARRSIPFDLSLLESLNQVFDETFNLTLSQIANPSVPAAFSPERNITLADGSETGQSIPFWSLIQPERQVDFIIAWDDDSDSEPYGWNNGTNMYNTYVLAKEAGLPFPAAPSPSTFLARNYTLKPTLFGCNTSLTTTGDGQSPIVLYMTNAPYSWYSNFSWSTAALSYEEFDGVLANSFDFVTQASGTLDNEWSTCIACAAIERSLERVGMERAEVCERCFERYCWDGTENTLPDGYVFDPALVLDPGYGFVEWNKTHPFSGGE